MGPQPTYRAGGPCFGWRRAVGPLAGGLASSSVEAIGAALIAVAGALIGSWLTGRSNAREADKGREERERAARAAVLFADLQHTKLVEEQREGRLFAERVSSYVGYADILRQMT